MPREGHGSRNAVSLGVKKELVESCPARGMGVEILC